MPCILVDDSMVDKQNVSDTSSLEKKNWMNTIDNSSARRSSPGSSTSTYVWRSLTINQKRIRNGWRCPEVTQRWFVLHGSKDENTIDVNRRNIQVHHGQVTF